MCGIFGEFLYNGEIDLDNCINRLNLMEHRGPDGFGFEYGNLHEEKYSVYHNTTIIDNKRSSSNAYYFFGHRRLSIIDLSTRASQPMESIDKRYSITFNGEIYNFIELKEELLRKGCTFKTDHSDTEVLLNAYLLWGSRFLEKIRGMFAFAILDRQNHTVFIARDRIGQKPLYYELSDKRFAFSSEMAPLLDVTGTSKRISHEALCCYMAFGYVPHPISIFEDVYKLPPATYALVDLRERSITTNRYWDVECVEDHQSSADEILKEVEDILTESVSLRLRADVPVAAFISGGTDSTLIVKKIKEIKNDTFDVFGADFPQTDRSEKRYIEEVAARYSLNLNLSTIDLSHVKNIRGIINIFDEPFDGVSSIALFDLFEKVQNKYKVIMTGDGGDETFAGYSHYVEFPPMHRIYNAIGSLIFPGKLLSALDFLGVKNRRVGKLYEVIKGDFVSNFILLNNSLEMVSLVKNGDEFRPDQFSLFNEIRTKFKQYRFSPAKSLQYLDLKAGLPGRMLYKLDRFSMFYSIEARSPFLDHKLVEKAFTIPDKLNINNSNTKMLLKKILEHDFPMEFVHRKKMGFGNPLSCWFRNYPPEEIFSILLNKKSEVYNYLDYDKLHKSFPQIKNGYDGKKERQLWRLLVLGQYIENFKDVIM